MFLSWKPALNQVHANVFFYSISKYSADQEAVSIGRLQPHVGELRYT